jgi:hypothetical protein
LIELDEFRGNRPCVLKIRELRLPVVALLMEQPSEIQEFWVPVPIIEPEHDQEFVVPAEFAPVAKRTVGQLLNLISKIPFQSRDDTLVAGEFLILRQHFHHDHARPPIVIALGADHAIGGLMLKGPIDVLLRLCFKADVIKQVGERDQAIQKVWPTFPGFTGSAEPSAIRTDIGPGFIQVTTQTVCLNLQLPT